MDALFGFSPDLPAIDALGAPLRPDVGMRHGDARNSWRFSSVSWRFGRPAPNILPGGGFSSPVGPGKCRAICRKNRVVAPRRRTDSPRSGPGLASPQDCAAPGGSRQPRNVATGWAGARPSPVTRSRSALDNMNEPGPPCLDDRQGRSTSCSRGRSIAVRLMSSRDHIN